MKNQRKSLGRRDALAEFVLDDRNSFPMLLREDVVQEGRFPAPEEAGEDRDGDLRHREPARGAVVHRARNGSARRSRVAPHAFFPVSESLATRSFGPNLLKVASHRLTWGPSAVWRPREAHAAAVGLLSWFRASLGGMQPLPALTETGL